MKKLRYWSYTLSALIAFIISNSAFAQTTTGQQSQNTFSNAATQYQKSEVGQSTTMRLGIVNTKKCLEESKLGKQEQANFEKMKHQMENVLQEKEKDLEELELKLNDDDYMDSISDEKASDLKRKRRTIRTDGMQLQNQYMQTLQQANLKIVQRLTDVISRASAQVAQDKNHPIDVIFTDEACTFYSPRLDISDQIIVKMNAIFDAEQKDNASKTR